MSSSQETLHLKVDIYKEELFLAQKNLWQRVVIQQGFLRVKNSRISFMNSTNRKYRDAKN